LIINGVSIRAIVFKNMKLVRVVSRDLSGCGCGDEGPVKAHETVAAQFRNLTGRGTGFFLNSIIHRLAFSASVIIRG